MEHDIVYYAKKRHTAKAYDAAKTIPKDTIEKIKDLLRFSPSSINVQPWYFILASSDEGKARVAKSTEEKFSFNKNNILDASHVVVFCNKLTIEEPYLLHLLEQESADGRYKAGEEAKQRSHSNRSMFLNVHKGDIQDERHWIEKQVYINLGQFLLGVAALGLDATPMEGIDTCILDKEFGLAERGFASLVVVALGFSKEDKDYNAQLPKSRLPHSEIITEI